MIIPEYTVWSLISVGVTVWLDRRFGTRLFLKGMYYVFLGIVYSFKWFINGYLTGQNIVVYNPDHYSGIRIGTIPLEDFLFGFSMVTLTIIFWEYCSSVFPRLHREEKACPRSTE